MAKKDVAKKATDALIDGEYQIAIDLYSEAIDADPTNADLYTDRAQACIKRGDFQGIAFSSFL
ncbi:Cochaperone protein [Ranunculus cassubicifolius]